MNNLNTGEHNEGTNPLPEAKDSGLNITKNQGLIMRDNFLKGFKLPTDTPISEQKTFKRPVPQDNTVGALYQHTEYEIFTNPEKNTVVMHARSTIDKDNGGGTYDDALIFHADGRVEEKYLLHGDPTFERKPHSTFFIGQVNKYKRHAITKEGRGDIEKALN